MSGRMRTRGRIHYNLLTLLVSNKEDPEVEAIYEAAKGQLYPLQSPSWEELYRGCEVFFNFLHIYPLHKVKKKRLKRFINWQEDLLKAR